MAVKDWSSTASSNTAFLSGISTDGSVMTVNQVDNAFREMAAQIASQLGKLGFKGSDIASATTTNLANATGWYVDITGTTTITGLGTVDAGQMFMLRFAGALTFTHNATSLILPGAANITTAAGDVAIVVSLGSGNWKCAVFQRASGVPLGYPSSSTDNTLPRFNGTAGALQTSGVTVDDSNNVTGVVALTTTGAVTAPNATLSSNAPTLTLTDTDTGADSLVSGSSGSGGLVLSADVNNEVANSTIAFLIDGSTKATLNASGNLTLTSITVG